MRTLGLLIALALLAVVACSDDDAGDGDQNAAQIGSLSENATYAYIEDEGAGLYDYLSTDVTERCTEEQVAEAAEGDPNITGWRQVKDIELTGNEATATVIVIIDGEDTDQTWDFVREEESWRISSLPGIEECTD